LAQTACWSANNGSGKNDGSCAIQIALVADGGEALFNRAANEKSRRTLHGYVRWKLGAEEELRPGFVRFGRGACTSYVLLEFRDDSDDSAGFTCGVGFEANETDTDVAEVYFLVPGAIVAVAAGRSPLPAVRIVSSSAVIRARRLPARPRSCRRFRDMPCFSRPESIATENAAQ